MQLANQGANQIPNTCVCWDWVGGVWIVVVDLLGKLKSRQTERQSLGIYSHWNLKCTSVAAVSESIVNLFIIYHMPGILLAFQTYFTVLFCLKIFLLLNMVVWLFQILLNANGNNKANNFNCKQPDNQISNNILYL